MTISRKSDLVFQPDSRYRTASQSRSSGWLGGSPWVPKSSSVSTRPDAEDLSPEAIDGHAGRQRVPGIDQPPRQPEPILGLAVGEADAATWGTPGSTTSPGSRKLPLRRMCVTR